MKKSALLLLFALASCAGGNPGTPVVSTQTVVQQIQAGWQRQQPAIAVIVGGLVLAKKITPTQAAQIGDIQVQITADVASLTAIQNPTTPAAIAADFNLLNGAFAKAAPGDAAWAALADELALALIPTATNPGPNAQPVPAA